MTTFLASFFCFTFDAFPTVDLAKKFEKMMPLHKTNDDDNDDDEDDDDDDDDDGDDDNG